MNVELQINNSTNPAARFRHVGAVSMPDPRDQPGRRHRADRQRAGITSASAAGGGAVVFRSGTTGAVCQHAHAARSRSTAPPCRFFVAGRFGRPSVNNGDVRIEARAGNTLVGSVPVMVRIRKNANTLTPAERDRFVAAFAQLNNQGARAVRRLPRHAHQRELAAGARRAGFLPWHRAYLLDLERELQAIDPSVALPYWRFDQPAPNLFTARLPRRRPMRSAPSSSANTTRCSSGGPTACRGSIAGRSSTPRGAAGPAHRGADAGARHQYPPFRTMEGNPHGSAHTSFGGSISSIADRRPRSAVLPAPLQRRPAVGEVAAPERPLQSGAAASFDNNAANPIGHNLPDTMWPWNGITGGPRPPTAPGGAHGPVAVRQRAGTVAARARQRWTTKASSALRRTMGFDYDDVRVANAPCARRTEPWPRNAKRRRRRSGAHEGRPAQGDRSQPRWRSRRTRGRPSKATRRGHGRRRRLAVCESDKDMQAMLDVLRDTDEPIEVRLAALQALQAASFSVRRIRVVPRRLHRDPAQGRDGPGSGASSARARHPDAREGRLCAEEAARRTEGSRQGAGAAREGAAASELRRPRRRLQVAREIVKKPPNDDGEARGAAAACGRRQGRADVREDAARQGRAARDPADFGLGAACAQARTSCRSTRARSCSTSRTTTTSRPPA